MAIISLFDFSGGYHGEKSDAQLKPTELADVDGFSLSPKGTLSKMAGFTRYNAVSLGPGPILGMHRHLHGDVPQLLVAHGGSIYVGDDQTGELAKVYGSQTPGHPTFFETWKGYTYIVNGVDPPLKWDGSQISFLLGGKTGASNVVQYADRLWLVTGNDTIQASDLLDPESWTDPDTGLPWLIDIDPGDDQRITGMVATQTRLFIAKTNSIYYLRGYDPVEWILDKITDNLGCIAPRSIVEMDGRTFFLSRRGVYLDDGSYFEVVSRQVQNILDEASLEVLQNAVGSHKGWKYRLDVPRHPRGPIRLEYDVLLKEWMIRTLDFPVASAAGFFVSGDTGDSVIGRADEGLVYYERGGSSDGTPITAKARTRRFGYDDPYIEKDLRRIVVTAKVDPEDTAVLRWYFDGNDHPAGIASLNDGRTVVSVPASKSLCTDVAFEVEVSGKGVDSRFDGLTADVRPRRLRWSR